MPNVTGEEAALRRLWYEWSDVVETYARRGAGRRRLRAADYDRLHTELLAVCRARAAAGGPSRGLYEHLLQLAQPWLGLATFDLADGEIVADLCLHCRRAGRALGGRPWGSTLRRWAARLPAALLVTAVAGGAGWLVVRYGAHGLRFLSDEYRPLLFAAKQLGGSTLLAAFTLVVVGGGVYLVMRIARG
jgi:hypothetical protein